MFRHEVAQPMVGDRQPAGCCCVVPAAVLRPGSEYHWFVTPRDAAGREACAPSEAVFVVSERR